MNRKMKVREVGPKLNPLETEQAIFFINRYFQSILAEVLALYRVSAPLFVPAKSGIQDNLNGTEQAVSFQISFLGADRFEVVHSLAKWKRYALYRYNIPVGKGIYTEMNALRPDEESLSCTHSVFVDQWDWEKVIKPGERNLETLKKTVKQIYMAIKRCEMKICSRYGFAPVLPREITFIHTGDLVELYPDLCPKERELMVCREYGAVFLIGIGGILADGNIHDGRAPDYDDWSTPTVSGRHGLNGDILVWNPVLEQAFELSSMGIRVDKATMIRQLEIRGCRERVKSPWHQLIINGKLPESIGGGIGQSRLCMFMLRKSHIGEVQASVWPKQGSAPDFHAETMPGSLSSDFPTLRHN